MRWRDERRSRLGRQAHPRLDGDAVPIDGNRVWSHLGQQELRVGQRIARVFYPHVVSRRQELLDEVWEYPCSMLSTADGRGALVWALKSRRVRFATSPGTRQYL